MTDAGEAGFRRSPASQLRAHAAQRRYFRAAARARLHVRLEARLLRRRGAGRIGRLLINIEKRDDRFVAPVTVVAKHLGHSVFRYSVALLFFASSRLRTINP